MSNTISPAPNLGLLKLFFGILVDMPIGHFNSIRYKNVHSLLQKFDVTEETDNFYFLINALITELEMHDLLDWQDADKTKNDQYKEQLNFLLFYKRFGLFIETCELVSFNKRHPGMDWSEIRSQNSEKQIDHILIKYSDDTCTKKPITLSSFNACMTLRYFFDYLMQDKRLKDIYDKDEGEINNAIKTIKNKSGSHRNEVVRARNDFLFNTFKYISAIKSINTQISSDEKKKRFLFELCKIVPINFHDRSEMGKLLSYEEPEADLIRYRIKEILRKHK